MRQIRRLIELIKRIFRRKKEDEEPIILDFKLPKKLDEITGDEIIGPKDGYKPLNYPLECSVNIKINIKKAGGLKHGRSK